MEDALVFYRQYHKNKWNQLIHVICVPVVIWTAFVWLAYTPVLVTSNPISEKWREWGLPSEELARSALTINISLLLALAYSATYIAWEPVAGASWAVCVALPLWALANVVRFQVDNAWKLALALHALAWYMQIHPGHGIFERRKPALMDRFVQAFAAAPFFVWLEVLFAFGYRPELQKRMSLKAGIKTS